jgi:hypothetical protein
MVSFRATIVATLAMASTVITSPVEVRSSTLGARAVNPLCLLDPAVTVAVGCVLGCLGNPTTLITCAVGCVTGLLTNEVVRYIPSFEEFFAGDQ